MVGRPREFDRDAALEAAMHLFWHQGYEATSVDELLATTGIQRGSLYAAFGDKRSLYLEALRAYIARNGTFFQEQLAGDPPLAKLRGFMRQMASKAENSDGNGCLLINALSERCPCDAEVREIYTDAMHQVEEMFYARLVDARDAGELTSIQTPRALARFMMLAFQGFILLSKQKAPRAVIQDNLRVVLSCLQ